jgi:hypothetical protein
VAVGYVGTSRAIVALNKDSSSETGRRAGRPSSTSYKNQNRDKSDHHDGPEDSDRRQKRTPRRRRAHACHETVNLLLRSGPSCAAALSAVVAAAYVFIVGMRCPLYEVRQKHLVGIVILGDILVDVVPSFSAGIGGNEAKTAAAFAAASLPAEEA